MSAAPIVLRRMHRIMRSKYKGMARAEHKVESTPTLFVNGKMVKGGVSIEELEKLMAPLLKS